MRSVVEKATSRGVLGVLCIAQAVWIIYAHPRTKTVEIHPLTMRRIAQIETDLRAIMVDLEWAKKAVDGLSIINSIQAGRNIMLSERINNTMELIDELRTHAGLPPIPRYEYVRKEPDDAE